MVKILAVVVLAVVWYAIGHEHAKKSERGLSAIASAVAGRPVRVHCQSFGGELVDVSADAGSVAFDDARPADVAKLKRKVCKSLERMRKDLSKPEFGCVAANVRCPDRVHKEIWAATVLAHESMHLAGEIREDVAECEGIQQTALVARRLGAGRKRAHAIAEYAWTYVYPEAQESYRTLDCFNGGPFDLRPADPIWP